MSDHERIWLAPKCNEGASEGRCWSPVALDNCEDCDSPAVEYVRADKLAAAEKRIEKLEAAQRGMLEAMAKVPVMLEEYGPDHTDDEPLIDAAHQARAALEDSK